MADNAIGELTDPYTEEVTTALQNGEEMRFTEAQCQEAHEILLAE